jgi:esterase/lipase
MNLAFFTPLQLTPKGGFPAVLLVHGYAGSKEDMTAIANLFSLNGYYCVEFSVRGQGAPAGYPSEGEFNWMTDDRILQDTKEIISWMQKRSEINKDKIGMLGGSQGGMITWNAAVNKLPIKCAIPIIAVPNLENACLNNGCLNYFCYNAITTGGKSIIYGPFMRDTLMPLVVNDDYYSIKNYVSRKDIVNKLSNIQIPLLIALAWQDDLFRVLDIADELKLIYSDKKLIIFPGGHGLPKDPSQLLGLMNLSIRFCDYWLKGIKTETIMNKDSAIILIDASENKIKYLTESNFNNCFPPKTIPITYYLTNNNKLIESVNSNVLTTELLEKRKYIKNITNDISLKFFSDPIKNDAELMSYKTSIWVNSDAIKYQANVLLYDYNPILKTSNPITRGSYQVRLYSNENKSKREIKYDLNPQYYLIRKGHQIEARVKFGESHPKASDEFGLSPFPPQSDANDTLFSSSDFPSFIELYPINQDNKSVEKSVLSSKFDLVFDKNLVTKGEPISFQFNSTKDIEIVLFNQLGAVVNRLYLNKLISSSTIPTDELSPGMYWIYACSGEFVKINKIIVIK